MLEGARKPGWMHNADTIEAVLTKGRGFTDPNYRASGLDALSVQMHLGNTEYLRTKSPETLSALATVANLGIACQTLGGRSSFYYESLVEIVEDVGRVNNLREAIPNERRAAEAVVLCRFRSIA